MHMFPQLSYLPFCFQSAAYLKHMLKHPNMPNKELFLLTLTSIAPPTFVVSILLSTNPLDYAMGYGLVFKWRACVCWVAWFGFLLSSLMLGNSCFSHFLLYHPIWDFIFFLNFNIIGSSPAWFVSRTTLTSVSKSWFLHTDTQDESQDYYKRQQLRELAMLNSPLREESPHPGGAPPSPFSNSGMKRVKQWQQRPIPSWLSSDTNQSMPTP